VHGHSLVVVEGREEVVVGDRELDPHEQGEDRPDDPEIAGGEEIQ
jgi:hypothetical protein